MAKLGKAAAKRRGRAPKVRILKTIEAALNAPNGFLLADNKGLTLSEVTTFRKDLRDAGVRVKVGKNRLISIALKKKGISDSKLDALLKGPTMLIIGTQDPVTPAKLLMEAAKKLEKLEVKGGYFEGKVLNPAAVESLSKMPSREELLSRFMSSAMSPIQKVVYALEQSRSKVVYAADAIRRKMEDGNAA